jgi:HEPN domain-containing protein
MATPISGKAAEVASQWVRWGDLDYVAARLLLLNGLLVQGAASANTAIEKFLKAAVSYSGLAIPHSHDVEKIYTKMRSSQSTDLELNGSFLRLLCKAYKLRYPDQLEKDFNIALNQARLLAQLDRSVLEITQRFRFTRNGKIIPTVLEQAAATQDSRYLHGNVAVDPSKTAQLFADPSHSYDLRNVNGQVLEVYYQSHSQQDDLVFDLQGFFPKSDRDFELAYRPIVDGSKPEREVIKDV